jgi:hypothetical protein
MGNKSGVKENDRIVDLGVDGRIILIWILRKRMGVERITFTHQSAKWWVHKM